jgi:transposase/DNA-binding CsgD family transcriptional regulator
MSPQDAIAELATLPEITRQIEELAHGARNGYSREEIARRLKISILEVRWHLDRARQIRKKIFDAIESQRDADDNLRMAVLQHVEDGLLPGGCAIIESLQLYGFGMAANDLLNLPTVQVVTVETAGGQYVVRADVDTAPSACPKCAGVSFYRHGSKPQLFADLPSHGHLVTIQIDRKRFRCRACGVTTFQPMPDMALVEMEDNDKRIGGAEGHMMTKRLVTHIGKAGLFRTFADVSRETGLDHHTVRRVVAKHIEQLEKTYKFETPDWLGLDEIHILGKVCGVVTNVHRRTLVDILPDRNEAVLGKFISNLPDKDLIEIVAIDMWRPYLNMAARYLPNAEVVIDRFHVVRMANDALDKVRKQVQATLPKGERLALKHERKALYMREGRLKADGVAAMLKWTEGHPLLGEVWAAKELFFTIWDTATSSAEASAMYDTWKAMLPESMEEPFAELTRALGNWREPIFRFFDKRVTNAYTEALNSVTRVVNRVGRGYSFDVLRAKMLYAHGQHVLDGRKLDRRLRAAASRSGPFSHEDSMIWGVDLRYLAAMIERGDI